MSIESVTPSNHLILCPPLLLPSIFLSIRVLSSESALHIRWPKYWSFSFSISPSNGYSGFISFRIDWFDLQSSLAPQLKCINSSVLILLYDPTLTSIHDYWKNHSFDICFDTVQPDPQSLACNLVVVSALWGFVESKGVEHHLALPQSSTEISVDNIVSRTEGSQTFKSQDCFTFLKLVENPKELCFCGSYLLVFTEFDSKLITFKNILFIKSFK